MRLEYIKDVLGNNYIGIKFDTQLVQPFLNEMKLHLSESDFNEYCKLQSNRDNGHYHMTVMNVMEYNDIIKKYGPDKVSSAFEKWESVDFHPKLMGIGSVSNNSNRAFFIVVDCESLNILREAWGLDKKDLHITLGFKWKDVHGLPKNIILERPNPFLNVIKQEWLVNENWNFLRKIGNFPPTSDDIIPYSLDNSCLKIAIGDQRIQINYLEDNNKLWVMAIWTDKGEVTPLSTNEIMKILKNG